MRALIENCLPDRGSLERDLTDEDDVEALLTELEEDSDVTVSFGVTSSSEEAELILGITLNGYLLTRYWNADFQQLVGDPRIVGEVELTLGGQPTVTPRRWLIERADVVRIIGQYLRDSTFPRDLSWEVP